MKRQKTREVRIGSVVIGGGNPVAIQSMLCAPPEDMEANVRQTRAQYEQLQLQTADTERNLRISIRQNLTTMETNIKSYYAAKEAEASARKGYDIAEKTYQVGRNTLIELNDAQLALTQARLGVSQTVYNFLTAKAQLEQVLGMDFTENVN